MSFANRADLLISFITLQYSCYVLVIFFFCVNSDRGNFLDHTGRLIYPKFKKVTNLSKDFVIAYKNAFSFRGFAPDPLTRSCGSGPHWDYAPDPTYRLALPAHHVAPHYQFLDPPLVVMRN
jgi:hypothetical protein